MKLFINSTGHIDFEAPIYMNDQQRDRFIAGIKKIFGDVEIEAIEEQIIERVGTHKSKKWATDELFLLTTSLSNEEIAAKTGREVFGVQQKRGSFLVVIQTWARAKGKSGITGKDIAQFIKETIK